MSVEQKEFRAAVDAKLMEIKLRRELQRRDAIERAARKKAEKLVQQQTLKAVETEARERIAEKKAEKKKKNAVKVIPIAGAGTERRRAAAAPGTTCKMLSNHHMRVRAQKLAAAGLTPVEYLLTVMRDENEARATRMQAAKDVAPYVHPKLQAVVQTATTNAKTYEQWLDEVRQDFDHQLNPKPPAVDEAV